MLRIILAIVMTVQAIGARVPGSIVFNGETAKPPVNLTRIRIVLAKPDDGDVLSRTSVGLLPHTALAGAGVLEDGTFVVEDLAPGTYFVSAALVQRPWKLATVLYDGKDSSNTGLTIERGAAPGRLVLTFSDRQTSVSGEVRDASGIPAPSSTVVIFPQNRLLWKIAGARVKMTQSGTNGTFMMNDLLPGHYLIASSAAGGEPNLKNVEYLEQLSRTAIKITLTDGQKLTQNLTLPK